MKTSYIFHSDAAHGWLYKPPATQPGSPPPYSFQEWCEARRENLQSDFNPRIVFDGYVWSLKQRGYTVYGNSIFGITVA